MVNREFAFILFIYLFTAQFQILPEKQLRR